MYFGKNYFGVQHALHKSNDSKIDYVEQCAHLGTTLYSDIFIRNINNAVNDLITKTNNLIRFGIRLLLSVLIIRRLKPARTINPKVDIFLLFPPLKLS